MAERARGAWLLARYAAGTNNRHNEILEFPLSSPLRAKFFLTYSHHGEFSSGILAGFPFQCVTLEVRRRVPN
jgi:hypothetical protein